MSIRPDQAMQEAINEAKKGIEAGDGGPFGAVIVHNDRIIARAHNRVLISHDPTAHAEVEAIRLASQVLCTHHLNGCTLYSTAEPCSMCYSAICWAQISMLYYGLTNKEIEALGFDEHGFFIKNPTKLASITVHSGVAHEECRQLINLWHTLQGKLY